MSDTNKALVGEINALVGGYPNLSIDIFEGLAFNQYQLFKEIEYYSNSRYLNGQLDELDREKPFRNIVNANVDVSVVATDIDTKDIQVEADDGQDYDKSFVFSKDTYQWMKQTNFAKFLNEMGETDPRYGGVLVKKCEEEDEDGENILKLEVVEWKNVVVDPTDILGGVIIEKHYMSPSKLSKKADVWDNVKEAMKLATTDRVDNGSGSKKASTKAVPIFEVHGEFTVKFYKEAKGELPSEDDEFTYDRYYIVLAGENGQDQKILYCEVEDENPYKYKAWKKVSGRDLGRGVVEEGVEAQVWTNDAVMKKHNALNLASKAIGQTASKKLKGRNVLTEIDNGTILEHEDGKPITVVNFAPSSGFQVFDGLVEEWFTQYERVTSTYDAQRGETPPSGQPFRLQALVQQQSGSMFSYRRQEKGIFLTEIFNDWVFPYLAKKLTKAHILAHNFSATELKELDKAYATNKANQKMKEMILSGQLVTAEDYEKAYSDAESFIQQTKEHRFLDIPEDYYKGIKAKVTVNITGEQKNKQAILESLSTILTLMQNPVVRQDPALNQIVEKMVEMSGAGISPLQLRGTAPAPMQQPMQGQQPAPEMSLAANPNPQQL
jgi:hypothetical protein